MPRSLGLSRRRLPGGAPPVLTGPPSGRRPAACAAALGAAALLAALGAALLPLPAGSAAGGDTAAGAGTGTGAAEGGRRAGYVHVDGAIDRLQARYFARALEDARREGLDTLVVHIDTDGGAVHYAREMFKAAMDFAPGGPAADGAGGAPGPAPRLVAFVDFRALSAGAMIAYAHHEVHLTEGASIGDIGVIFQAQDGTIEYAPEKIETVVRTLLAQASERRGWPRGPLLKMTARNQKLYRAVPPEGEAVYVIEDDLPEWLAAHPEVDREDSEQLFVYRGEDRLLTLTGREAVALGMASGLVADLPALYERLGIDPEAVTNLGPGTAERTAAWLAGLAPILMGLAILLLFFELNTPGVGIWVALAAVCGGLFLFAHYYLDLVENFELVLVLAGFALILVEAFLLPLGGLLVVAGALSLLAGMVLAFLPNELEFAPADPDFREAFVDAVFASALALAVAGVGLLLFFRYVPRVLRFGRRVRMEAEIAGTSEGTAGEGGGFGAAAAHALVGRTGRAEGALRPAGTVLVGGTRHSARAQHGTWIGDGEAVEVVDAGLGELVVRAADR